MSEGVIFVMVMAAPSGSLSKDERAFAISTSPCTFPGCSDATRQPARQFSMVFDERFFGRPAITHGGPHLLRTRRRERLDHSRRNARRPRLVSHLRGPRATIPGHAQ